MNPLVAQQLKEIARTVEELGESVRVLCGQLQTVSTAREDLQKKVWSQSREVHLLRQQLEEFPELKSQCEQFRSLKSDLEQRLQSVLSYARALGAEYHP